MIKASISALALVGLLGMSYAQAAAITNHDATSHQITVRERDNGSEKIITIEASQNVTDLCAGQCDLFLDDDPDPYEVATGDVLGIEAGQLHYESDETDQKDKTK